MLGKLWVEAWSHLFVEPSRQELGWLISREQHISLLSTRRAGMIVSRVRLMASLFAILTPLWIPIDILILPFSMWSGLALARLFATAGFAYVVVHFRDASSIRQAYRALMWIIAIPIVFFLATHLFISQFELSGLPAVISSGYGFLPFVLVAGLSVFPLTAKETLAGAAAVFLVFLIAAVARWSEADVFQLAVEAWLLLLIGSVSALAGMSQLGFMIALVREAIRDPLTGVFSRLSGEELLELQFIISTRAETPLTVAFLDLDRFKDVNDRWGHEAGDRVLKVAAERVRAVLRTGDMMARWGGEEFVIIMPNTRIEQACAAIERLRANGMGLRPDGKAITASIGLAERLEEGAPDWHALLEMADTRMYASKSAGRNCVTAGDRAPAAPATPFSTI